MMNELIVEVKGKDVYLAVLQDKNLVEFNHELADSAYTVGDLYLARVSRVMPNLNAAFIDVGYEKDAFLHYFDLGPQIRSLNKFISELQSGKVKTGNLMYLKPEPDIVKEGKIVDVIKPGQKVLVKIAKEPISQKGPRLSCEISIPGRYLVLAPFGARVSVSSKIKDSEERKRLKDIIEPVLPKNFGCIIRTAAKGVEARELQRDLEEQLVRWNSAVDMMKVGHTPVKVLGELKRTSAILRDLMNESFSFDSVVVNSKALHDELRDFVANTLPGKEKIIKFYEGKADIFDAHKVTKQVKALFGRQVGLPSGGYLIIEHTEALHVIDVNSGNMLKKGNDQETNAIEANLEAAAEIARQLRLRDMGGIIVVDFIDMHKAENKQKLYEFLKTAMKNDRAKHNVLPPSKIGLVQITRERVRPVIDIETKEVCPTCHGTGKAEAPLLIVDDMENEVRYLMTERKGSPITIECHPFVHAFLTKGWIFSLANKWKRKYKGRIEVKSNMSLPLMEYRYKDKDGVEINV
ncbi:MAG: Rne/Rng family ribonuclease [Bacteroidia bacterium]|nr:Rne/Rng family ribonuclease [Bacteroidia bacterium]